MNRHVTLYLVPESVPLEAYGREDRFHTLNAALREMALRKGRNPELRSGEIRCKPGVYLLKEQLLITPDECSVPVTVHPDTPEGEVVFDRGFRLTGWSPVSVNGRTALRAVIPAGLIADGRIPQLHVNGKRAAIASWPGNGRVLTPEAAVPELQLGPEGPARGFRVAAGDFNPEWHHQPGMEVVMFQMWNDSHLPVERFDPETRDLSFRNYAFREIDRDTRYLIENVREMLTSPGEYYFDSTDGSILYIPLAGETAESIEAVIPRPGPLMLLAGDDGRWIENLDFDHLTFRYAGGGTPVYGDFLETHHQRFPRIRNPLAKFAYAVPLGSAPQGAIHVPGIATGTQVKNCSFRHCEFTASNSYALAFYGGMNSLTVTRCHMHDLGGGGMILSGSDEEGSGPSGRASGIVAADNHMHALGRTFRSAIGILLGYAEDCLIEHNHIHDLYYTAISAGWRWGYGPSRTGGIRIGHNLLHDLGQGVLCDMGGVYTLGIQPGTRIYGNVVRDVVCRRYGGFGIYLDEGSSHIVVEGNFCCDCACQGFEQHFGRENIYRFNLSAFGRDCAFRVKRGAECRVGYSAPGENYGRDATIVCNVLWPSGGKAVYSSSTPGGMERLFADLNFIGNHSEEQIALVMKTRTTESLAAWQSRGLDVHSFFGDPGFVDPEKRDFRLKPDSVLKSMNFPDPAATLAAAGIRKEEEPGAGGSV